MQNSRLPQNILKQLPSWFLHCIYSFKYQIMLHHSVSDGITGTKKPIFLILLTTYTPFKSLDWVKARRMKKAQNRSSHLWQLLFIISFWIKVMVKSQNICLHSKVSVCVSIIKTVSIYKRNYKTNHFPSRLAFLVLKGFFFFPSFL